MKHLVLGLTVAVALSACNNSALSISASEVGIDGDAGGFGTAVNQNLAINSDSEAFRIDLARRFAAEVPTTVNFAFNSAALDPQAQSILTRQADFIRQFPEVRFRVYGHTDLVGSSAYNEGLGMRRAQAVVAYLSGQGISRSRLEAVVSRGETQPLIVTEGRERANRRTVTEVSGFVEDAPGQLNGKYAEIIFRDYVASAAIEQTIGGITGSELATGQ